MNFKDSIGVMGRKEIITISGTVICFLLFSLVIKLTGINVGYITNFQNNLIKFMILGSSDLTLETSIFVFISSFMRLFIGLILLVAGFAFLSSYGFLDNRRNIGLIASLISSLFIFLILGFSVVPIFLSLSVIVSSILIIPLANTYGKELKRWILFRSGSHSISTALLIVNIMIGLGIFLAISVDINHYQTLVKDDFADTMEKIALAELSASGDIPESYEGLVKDQIAQKTEDFFSNSLLMGSFIKFLPVIIGFSAWAFLELLRMLALPSIGGIISDALIRINRNIVKDRMTDILNTVNNKKLGYENKK